MVQKKFVGAFLDPKVLDQVDTIYPENRSAGIRELVDKGLEVKKNEIYRDVMEIE